VKKSVDIKDTSTFKLATMQYGGAQGSIKPLTLMGGIKMKLRTKIFGGFMIMALVAVILGVTGLVSTMKLERITSELHTLQRESDSVSKVLNAHYAWRQGLTESVLTGNEFKGSVDPHSCALGQWYDSEEAQNMSDPVLLEMLKQLDAPHATIHNEAKNVAALIEAGEMEAAKEYLEAEILPKTTEVITILTGMQAHYVEIVDAKDAESIKLAESIKVLNSVFILLAVIICMVLAYNISSMISKPLVALSTFMKKAGSTGDITLTPLDIETISKYSHVKDEIGQTIDGASSFIRQVTTIAGELKHIANGDLTLDVELLSDDDVMGKSVKQVVDNLNSMFGEIDASTSRVSTSAGQVAEGAQMLAQGATEQAAAIEQLSNSIAEISKKTRANADTADETSKLSEAIMQDAEKGSRKMEEMITAVNEINEASQNISRIIKTINDIAFQTNILALNAAVEAARAGHHGKGFAVVAEEVRNLAAKSAEAAKDTGSMIQNSMEKAELGSCIVEETATSLKEIVSGITEASRKVTEIAKSSEEQSLGITSINIGIDKVAQVVQQNSATAEQSAAASEEMNGQSTVLKKAMAQFKLKDNHELSEYQPVPQISRKKINPFSWKNNYALQAPSGDSGEY